MNLAAKDLATYQQSMMRAKALRGHACADCQAIRDDGRQTFCAICRGDCCNCGGSNVTHPGRTLADGRVEFWCDACDAGWEAAFKAEDERARDIELTADMPDRKDVEF